MKFVLTVRKTMVHKKKLCIKSDKASVKVKANYKAAAFTVPGNGTFKILMLMPSQVTKKTKEGNNSIITKGQKFMGMFKVEKPAQMPPPPSTPDPMPIYPGAGNFPNPANTDVFAG